MFGSQSIATPLDTIAHIIQVALTPVFLLSGIATLLNVFSTRLARVADRVDQVTQAMDGADADQLGGLTSELTHLNRRSVALDAAVILAAVGGAATCAAVLTLFVGALRDATVASVLFILFGLAVVCALGAIGAFTAEMLMTGFGVRARCTAGRRAAAEGGTEPAAPPPDGGVSESPYTEAPQRAPASGRDRP